MELLAFFLKEHFLFTKSEYFNFGGRYTFKFELKENGLTIEKFENVKYISSFFGNQISNISAIVGNNGVGKSSLLKILNQDPKHEIVSIYFDGQNIYIRNQSKLVIDAKFKYSDYKEKERIYPLYYSSHIDYSLKSFYSPINQSNLIDDSIEDYYYDTIVRQVFFLNQKGQFLEKSFKDLPYYENLTIKVNNINKSKFLDSDFYKEATIGKSIKKQLEMLWNYYNVSNEETIHGDFNFINNFEVFILSLLVTDDTFAKTNSNGFKISFQDVLDQPEFERKLEVFLKKRLDNIDKSLFETLEESSGIKFLNVDDLIQKIKSNKFSQISGGFDFTSIKNHLVQTIIRYSRIFELYRFISMNSDKILIFEKPNDINISVKKDSSENFLKTFIQLYQDVHETLQYITFEFRIFNIFPEKKLSTGEQSLLNFYSSVYAFVRKGENHIRKFNQYLLLLDEPETGYHAVWKKKFIKSITEILPELFNELSQKPSIQIIFSTHDALTLSDIPNDNITYLQKFDDSSIKVFKLDDEGRPLRSFGANITDLLSDSFFVGDGLIGDFAKKGIQSIIKWLNDEKRDLKKVEDIRKLITIIDEPITKTKLAEMFDLKLNEHLRVSIIRKQIEDLEKIEKALIE